MNHDTTPELIISATASKSTYVGRADEILTAPPQ